MRTGNFSWTKAATMWLGWSAQCEDSAQCQDKTVQERPMQNADGLSSTLPVYYPTPQYMIG